MKHDLTKEAIRIGTLVGCGENAPNYIRQINEHGFESYCITFWQTSGDIELKEYAKKVKDAAAESGAIISAVSCFGNPLGSEAIDQQTVATWEKLIDTAHLFGCDIVSGFAGRVVDIPIDQSMKQFKTIYEPMAKRALDKGVRLAFENCDMGGTWGTGNWNIAQFPVAWEMMFNEIPLPNLGLEWEPCHQLVKLIDPLPQLRKWAHKVFHVHGKDATVYWDIVREFGVFGPKQFAFHRTPGFGDSNWTEIISVLRSAGFKGSVDIEGWHDPVYKDTLEMQGQVHALNHLKQARGGFAVANPT